MIRRFSLVDLEAEIANLGLAPDVRNLVFVCPVPRCNHSHRIPFRAGGGTLIDGQGRSVLIWDQLSGSKPEDLTLGPSYRLTTLCRFHCWIRGGVVEVLSDTAWSPPRDIEI